MCKNSLVDDFTNYLATGRAHGAVAALCASLSANGHVHEANALRWHMCSKSHALTVAGEVWGGRECLTGEYPPASANFGSLWFDTIELSFAVFVPNAKHYSADSTGWLSVSPVRTWQFLAFSRLVKLGPTVTDFPCAADYLLKERFQNQDCLGFATNMYQDEALAYSTWFGKCLSHHILVRNASVYLSGKQFGEVLPASMALWDNDFSFEGLNRLINQANIHELIIPPDPAQVSDEKTTLVKEWHSSRLIGLSTAFYPHCHWPRTRRGKTTYYHLNNTAMAP